MEMKAYEHG